MIIQSDNRKECCRVEANLGAPESVNKSVSFRRCQVCQCRHFEMIADLGILGIKGTSANG